MGIRSEVDPCPDATCHGRCGRYATNYACFCDSACVIYNDCCHDYIQLYAKNGRIKFGALGEDEDYEWNHKIIESRTEIDKSLESNRKSKSGNNTKVMKGKEYEIFGPSRNNSDNTTDTLTTDKYINRSTQDMNLYYHSAPVCTYVEGINNLQKFRIVSECNDIAGYNAKIVEKCHKSNNGFNEKVFVFSYLTQLVYRNIYCAQCNGLTGEAHQGLSALLHIWLFCFCITAYLNKVFALLHTNMASLLFA